MNRCKSLCEGTQAWQPLQVAADRRKLRRHIWSLTTSVPRGHWVAVTIPCPITYICEVLGALPNQGTALCSLPLFAVLSVVLKEFFENCFMIFFMNSSPASVCRSCCCDHSHPPLVFPPPVNIDLSLGLHSVLHLLNSWDKSQPCFCRQNKSPESAFLSSREPTSQNRAFIPQFWCSLLSSEVTGGS